MRIEWSSAAMEDLRRIGAFLATEARPARRSFADNVTQSLAHLLLFPNLGRPGRCAGTRELVVSGTPLVLVYRSQRGVIRVVRVLHQARRWPPGRR